MDRAWESPNDRRVVATFLKTVIREKTDLRRNVIPAAPGKQVFSGSGSIYYFDPPMPAERRFGTWKICGRPT
jgi:hypothetical protein